MPARGHRRVPLGRAWSRAGRARPRSGGRRGAACQRTATASSPGGRRWAWAVGGACALVAALVAWGASRGVSPADLPLAFADQAAIVAANADAKAGVTTYAAYASVPDQSWVAGETSQRMTIQLPATATHTNADGEEVTEDNPVYAAPHVYVDLDGDGEFAEDECLWNPMERDADGTVTNVGQLLRPGNEVSEVELARPLDAGEYDAELLWTGVLADTHELANPISFRFRVTAS